MASSHHSDDIEQTLLRHHALFALLPQEHRRALLEFTARFLARRDIALRRPESRLDVLVAANAALVGMYLPVDDFSSIEWIYIGEGDGTRDGEAWGSNKLLLEREAVIEESAAVIPGANVVIHEFAHVLDHMLGLSGRTPALRGALEEHLETLNRGEPTCIADWRDSIPIDMVMESDFSYLEQVEFFAYASEAFFTAPIELRRELPRLYDELLKIYRIDMAELFRASAGRVRRPWPRPH